MLGCHGISRAWVRLYNSARAALCWWAIPAVAGAPREHPDPGHSLTTIDGPSSLADYQGKVLLLVNVASVRPDPAVRRPAGAVCGKHAQGLEVLGFPANNFLGQEPGSEAEIQQFCQLTYDVSFPMFSKISVAGDDTHPLYQQLTAARSRSAKAAARAPGQQGDPDPSGTGGAVELREVPGRP